MIQKMIQKMCRTSLSRIRSLTLLILCCMLLLSCVPLQAAEKKLPSGIAYEELDASIKNYIKEHESTTVGLAWSVFDEKEDISSGYYGYANREKEIPADEEMVFEWGSGSKILVWLSVMQLYDQGKIDLEEDIRTYLPEGFLTNQKYEKPVTMLNLMNHTAGFEYGMADVNINKNGVYSSLEEAVSAHKPAQINEPGTITSYSNWGTSLAAYIVGQISGMEYADYVHQNIFEPLGMEHTAIYMDLSDNKWVLDKRQEQACYTVDGELLENSFVYITLYPSGRCTSTFGDFTTLAKAILNKDPRIMKQEAWDTMFTPSDYYEDTDLPKNYHGLWCIYLGVPAVGHIGRTTGSSCYLLVDPEHKIGSLFACNQSGDLVYTEGVRSLIYGDFKYSDYGEEPALPKKDYRNVSLDTGGAFKLMSFFSAAASPLNTSGQYYKPSSFGSLSRIEFAYMDYQEISGSRRFAESFTFGSYIAGLIFLAVTLLGRLLLKLFRKNKEKRELSLWSIISSVLPFTITILYLYSISSVSYPSSRYIWALIAIGVITVLMCAAALYGIIKNVRADLPRIQKIYNYMIIIVLILTVIYVCYWNMFMFWRI